METNGIRSRRVATALTEQKPVESPTASTSTEAAPVAGSSTVPNSEIAALRDEINGATNEQARARLRQKLVDHLVSAGLKQEALAELKVMSEEDRFDPPGFYNIANAQARIGDSDGAIRSYRKAIEQRKGLYSRASNNLGVVLLRTGQWDEAYEVLMSVLRQESFRYAEASFNLGRLYAARGEKELAVREWRRAVAVDPKHVAAAKALSNSGYGDIVVTSRSSGSIPTTASSRTSAAMGKPRSTSTIASSKTAPTGVSKAQRAGSRPVPSYTMDSDSYALLQRGQAARERGRNEEAVENYRQLLSRMGGYFPPANLDLAYALIALKRNDEAIETLLPISIKDGTQIPISYYHLGRLYELRGELKLAEDSYTRAAEAYGESNNQFILDIGRVQEKQGNLTGALMKLEQYITAMERQGLKPSWSDERLAALRQKLAASQPKP